MLSAFEQMNKNIAVVAEVAAWARKLGRTFVEPTYCYSRVAPPFDSMEAGGPVLRKELGNHAGKLRDLNRTDLWNCSIAKERLSAVRDVGGLCRGVPTISPGTFLRRLAQRPALKESIAVFFQGTHLKEVLEGSQGKAIVYLVGLHRRHVSNQDIADGECITKPCHGLTAGPAPSLIKDARKAADRARPYTCINVRSETTLTSASLGCPTKIYAAAARAWIALPEARNGTQLIVSDLYSATSGTYTAGGRHDHFKAILRARLEKLLFGGGSTSAEKPRPLNARSCGIGQQALLKTSFKRFCAWCAVLNHRVDRRAIFMVAPRWRGGTGRSPLALLMSAQVVQRAGELHGVRPLLPRATRGAPAPRGRSRTPTGTPRGLPRAACGAPAPRGRLRDPEGPPRGAAAAGGPRLGEGGHDGAGALRPRGHRCEPRRNHTPRPRRLLVGGGHAGWLY